MYTKVRVRNLGAGRFDDLEHRIGGGYRVAEHAAVLNAHGLRG